MREILIDRLAPNSQGAEGQGADWRSDYDLNQHLRPDMPPLEELTDAAVLVPIVDRAEGLTVLFTRRTEHLRKHAGQISFPGGRCEPDDPDAIACALRETEEEIGLTRSFIDVFGRLDPYVTVTGFRVVPVVGFVAPGFTLTPDAAEVAEVFEVPLAFLLDPGNHQRHSGTFNGMERHWYAIPYGDYNIWGATAGMLMNLYHKVSAS